MRRLFALLLVTWVALAALRPAAASAADAETGPEKISKWSVKPVVGSVATIAGPLAQAMLAIGVDAGYSLSKPLSFVFGARGATAEDFISAEVHLGVKRTFFGLNPVVLPFVGAGLGFTWGFPHGAMKNKNTITGLGVRTGLGLDFVLTPRILPGLQVMFEYGPRFLPNAGILATASVSFGVTFLL